MTGHRETSGRRNRLAAEKSPYLLQHAGNPVDWRPWGEEAFRAARESDRPVFLSIGYATCHWCHVMERESFEDEETAALLDSLFIPVKVDREERPDVDAVYMAAVQAMGVHGGWPLSVFLAPDGRPFFGGTYFPPEDRWGRPGFRTVLTQVAAAYRDRREEVLRGAADLAGHLRRAAEGAPGPLPGPEALRRADREFIDRADREHGGFAGVPKFPCAHALSFLLRRHLRTGDAELLAVVERTLRRMAAGGIFDHLGGGFHRYSTDERWFLPHFEKMLYDQALLAVAYVEAFSITGNREYAEVARDVFRYVRRDLAGPGGSFLCAEDADAEGEEGRFSVFTRAEIVAALGEEEGRLFALAYGVREEGNYEDEATGRRSGANVLHRPRPLDETAAQVGVAPAELARRMAAARAALFAVRERRPRPAKDDKVLTDWNGLMIAALATGARVLDDEDLAEAAAQAASFLLDRLVRDGRLLHRYRDGEAAIRAFLPDHAFLALGLVELYETTFEPRWLFEARRLADEVLRLFPDGDRGGFLLAPSDGERLLAPVKDLYDGAIPSGNSVAALVLARLGRHLSREDYTHAAEGVLSAFAPLLTSHPFAFPAALAALDFLAGPPREIVLAGSPADPGLREMARVAHRRVRPGTIIALRPEGPGLSTVLALQPALAPLLPREGRATAFVCEGYACREPVTSAAALAAMLDGEIST